jgi:hypothetical protein
VFLALFVMSIGTAMTLKQSAASLGAPIPERH